MTRVLAFGPESSGTRWLKYLLEAGGADATHRSQPNGITWVDAAAMLYDYDRVVVILRSPVAHVASMTERGIVASEADGWAKRRRQLAAVAPILGDPRVEVVTFEGLAARHERRALLERLGLDPGGADAIVYDPVANEQHYPLVTGARPRIPTRLIRCVPAATPPEWEAWWARFGEMHPGWDLRTVRDPITPDEWPLLGHLHRHATSGAQLAGMVRLEAVHRWGGFYIDGDVEPVRPFDPLVGPDVVIGTEDGTHLTDAVFGAPAHHPAIRAVIDHVRELYAGALRDGRELPGAQASGPLATTAVLAGRPDVRVLPVEAFYPYSYLEPDRAGEDFAAVPGCYAVHRWAFTWNGQ